MARIENFMVWKFPIVKQTMAITCAEAWMTMIKKKNRRAVQQQTSEGTTSPWNSED